MGETSWRDLLSVEMARHGDDFSRVESFRETDGDVVVEHAVWFHSHGLLDRRWNNTPGALPQHTDWVITTHSRIYFPANLVPPHVIQSWPRPPQTPA